MALQYFVVQESTSPHEPMDEGTDSPMPPSNHDGAATDAAHEASTSPHHDVSHGSCNRSRVYIRPDLEFPGRP